MAIASYVNQRSSKTRVPICRERWEFPWPGLSPPPSACQRVLLGEGGRRTAMGKIREDKFIY